MQNPRWQTRNLSLEMEQSTGKRLFGELLFIQQMARRGGERRAKIVAAKRELGDVGTREADGREQFSPRRIASRGSAVEQTDPHAPFGVGYRSVRMTRTIFDFDEDALVGDVAV